MKIHELRDCLRQLDPDVVFLQEVQGLHMGHARNHANWPSEPQHEFLADKRLAAAYGSNAAYDHGHHGNAVLSRFDILSAANHDVTEHHLERRGLLHCVIKMPQHAQSVHCICVHLSLTKQQRQRQFSTLIKFIKQRIPANAPIIIAGDFNDWNNHANTLLAQQLGLTEAFTSLTGNPARSFPSKLPVLRLDRIYVRGFAVAGGEVHCGKPWSSISDHAALTAELHLS